MFLSISVMFNPPVSLHLLLQGWQCTLCPAHFPQ